METSLIQTPLENGTNSHTENTTSNRFLRNKDLIDQQVLDKATIIGAGGIGSSLVRCAAIMGFRQLTIWDYDTLEEHNLSTTTFSEEFLSKPKAETAATIASRYGCENAIGRNQPWSTGQSLDNIVFMCPDNMEVRMGVYRSWSQLPDRKLLIDMRMGALTMEIITVTKEYDNFRESWQPSKNIPDEECTAKHTIFTGSLSSGTGLSQAFQVLNNRPYYAYIWMSLAPVSLKREKLVIQ